jgi:gliding motility-associated protein GldM
MAGGKETPRQKMIGMMYLVLTALLALNVSKEILNAFVVVNSGLEVTNRNFGQKNNKTYGDFEAANTKDPAKTKPFYERAQQAQKMSNELVAYIDAIKKHIIMETDGVDEKAADSIRVKIQFVSSKDNNDVPTHVLIGDDPGTPKSGKFSAKELKQKLNDMRSAYIKLFDDPNLFLPTDKAEMEAKLGLKTEKIQVSDDGTIEDWENGNFYHLPLVAVIANLTKIQADIKNAEADVINKLFTAVKGKEISFDKLVAKVIAPSSYILSGDTYKADVLVVGVNSTQNPTILLGPVDSLKQKGDNSINPLIGPGDSSKVKVMGGLGKYEVQAGAEGLQKYSGVIKVEKPGGGYNYYPFSQEYIVAKPAAAVALDKMNVFYIGLDNPVTISVAGVAPENISPSISGAGGKITGSRGKYVVRVAGGAPECSINVGAKFGGANKPMGSFKFRVKRVPDPVGYVAGKKGDDQISRGEASAIAGVIAKLENFEFDTKFDVIAFDMTMLLKGNLITESSSSNRMTDKMSNLIKYASSGTKIYFENIKAKGPDGTTRKIPGVNLKVK